MCWGAHDGPWRTAPVPIAGLNLEALILYLR